MKSKSLCICKLPTAEWVDQITKERVISDWIWLLGYEGIRHGWLPDPNNVMAEPFFSAMAKRDVTFYDQGRNVPSSTNVTKKRKQFRKAQILDVQKFIRILRGFGFHEY